MKDGMDVLRLSDLTQDGFVLMNAEDVYQDVKFEITTFPRKVVDILWIPFLNLLPKRPGINAFNRSSKDGAKVRKFATTFKALEIFYDFDGFKLNPEIKNSLYRLADGVFTYIWQNIHNVQAVRNRLKIVEKELEEAIYFIGDASDTINLVSLGAGSARGVISVLSRLSLSLKRKMKVYLVDKSKEAHEYSEYLISKFKLGYSLWLATGIP